MRKIQLIIALAICFSTDLEAQFLVGKVPANVCPGSRVDVPFIYPTPIFGNVFTAELSSSTGSFASPVIIGTLSSVYSGTIQATMPATASGSGYRIRVYSTNLRGYSTESTPINTSNAPGSIPSIGDYGNASVGSGGNVKVAPLTSPANASWLRMSASANNGFQGQLHVDPMTGIVSVINAKPQGTYQVRVTAVNCKGAASKTFTLTVTNPACSQGQFGAKKSFSYAFTVAGTLIGDFNNDGYPDVIQLKNLKRSIRVNLNDRAGGFVSNDLVNFGYYTALNDIGLSLAQGDFNRDGNQDIVFATVSKVLILHGDGLGGFSGNVVYEFNSISSVKVGDFNRDGLHDILVASETGTVSVLLGDGFGLFTAGPSVNLGFMSRSPLAVGDFNKDGNPDILTASASQKKYAIAMGNGSGGFAAPVTSVTGSLDYVERISGSNTFGVGDFNGDGNLDLAATTFRSSPNTKGISILLGNGSGGFTLKSTLSASNDYIISITVADFNGDGKPDVAATSSSEAYVFFGTGSAEFTNARQLEKDLMQTRNIEMLDFNNDKLQDVFIEDEGSGSTLLMGDVGDIQLKGNGIAIADGSTTMSTNNNTNFGGNCLGVNIQKTFTIHNTGSSPIQLNSGAITFTGTDAAMFSVTGATLPKTLASRDSMTFTVRFSPTSAGNQTATIRIASDDCDEADYDFSCQATTYPPTPTAPTGLSATPMNSSAFVYFTTPVSTCSSSITGWQYSANNGPWTAFTPGTVPPRLYLTNLTNGTTYSIKVRAVNTAGVGAESAPVNVTPRTQAGAPTGLTATPANNTASIAFTAPASNGGATITNYQYSINNGGWAPRNPAATTSPLSLTGLVNG
ncbi:MAG: FG-GAP-like repeat-containing protein, partial [Chitinophagaceae bacterium]